MAESRAFADLIGALVRLRQVLDAVPLGLDGGQATRARERRAQVVALLEDYVLPRLLQVEAPLLGVVGGPTGSGKSTLVNSLVRRTVSVSGVLRPTTHLPVLVHHPDDAVWFAGDRVLSDVGRGTGRDGTAAVQLVASDAVPQGIALLDAPDVDSVDRANRALAAEILSAADLWLFVTSAARYADQVSWEVLAGAANRSTAVAVVLDRTDPGQVDEVRTHLARMMTARGFAASPLLVVPEGRLDDDGLLPPDDVGQVRDWLGELAADLAARGRVVERSLFGSLRTVARGAYEVADVAAEQAVASSRLRARTEAAFDDGCADALSGVEDGSLLRGAVLARWVELVASGDAERWARGRAPRAHRRLARAVRGGARPLPGRLREAVAETVAAHVLDAAARAGAAVSAVWRDDPASSALHDADAEGAAEAARELRERVDAAVAGWQGAVAEAVGATLPAEERAGDEDRRVGLAAVVQVALLGGRARDEPAAGVRDQAWDWFGQAAPTDVTALRHRLGDGLAATVRGVLHEERRCRHARVDELGTTREDVELVRHAARRVDDLRPSEASA